MPHLNIHPNDPQRVTNRITNFHITEIKDQRMKKLKGVKRRSQVIRPDLLLLVVVVVLFSSPIKPPPTLPFLSVKVEGCRIKDL